MLLSRVGKKSKLTGHHTKTSKLTLSCSSVSIFVQEIKKTNTRRPKQKTNPPSKTVVPSIDSLLSAFFFELTADFGHVPGVRLQDRDDFSIACAWTETSRTQQFHVVVDDEAHFGICGEAERSCHSKAFRKHRS